MPSRRPPGSRARPASVQPPPRSAGQDDVTGTAQLGENGEECGLFKPSPPPNGVPASPVEPGACRGTRRGRNFRTLWEKRCEIPFPGSLSPSPSAPPRRASTSVLAAPETPCHGARPPSLPPPCRTLPPPGRPTEGRAISNGLSIADRPFISVRHSDDRGTRGASCARAPSFSLVAPTLPPSLPARVPVCKWPTRAA